MPKNFQRKVFTLHKLNHSVIVEIIFGKSTHFLELKTDCDKIAFFAKQNSL